MIVCVCVCLRKKGSLPSFAYILASVKGKPSRVGEYHEKTKYWVNLKDFSEHKIELSLP